MMQRLVAILTFCTLTASIALAQNPSKLESLTRGKPELAKISTEILRLSDKMGAGKSLKSALAPEPAVGSFAVRSLDHALRDGKLQCVIGVDAVTKDIEEACKKAGLEVVGSYSLHGMNQIVVQTDDPRRLEALAARADVRSIAPEPEAIKSAGAVANQADVSIRANLARSDFGVDGTGVRIGVLSDSINDNIGGVIAGGNLTGTTPQLSGDLPSSIRVLDDGPGGGIDEGAAMMELIHDLAPGADLSFASAFTSYAAFAANINNLRTDPGFECDVIVDDVFYTTEPVYQNGPIAIAANNAFANGVPYFSSAGNNANTAHEDTYVDANPGSDNTLNIPNGADWHDFGAGKGLASDTYLAVTLNPGGVVALHLQWDEPGNGTFAAGAGAVSDLDLYALATPAAPSTVANIITRSINVQGTVGSPFGYPYEQISGLINTSTTTAATFYVAVDHYRGREPVLLHLLLRFSGPGGFIADAALAGDRTIFGHSAAENASAVAAMFYGEIDTNGSVFNPLVQLDVEPFSSLGGALPFPIDDAGNRVAGTIPTVNKPDITAPDGTNTTFFGNDSGFDADTFPNFFGTSAAAPHAAAVAALLLDRSGGLTPDQVYTILETTTREAETTGYDFLAGHGLIDARNAVEAVPGGPTATPTPKPTDTPTPTPTATPTATPTPTPSPTATPTATPVPTPIPTAVVDLLPSNVVLHHPPASAAINAMTQTFVVGIQNATDLGAFNFEIFNDVAGILVASESDIVVGPFLGSTGNTIQVNGPNIYTITHTVQLGAQATTDLPGPDGNGALGSVTYSTQFVPEVTDINLFLQNVTLQTTDDDPYPPCLTCTLQIPPTIQLCYFADIDCNDIIDVVDIQRVAGDWNKPVGDPSVERASDVDGDKDVDIVDIQLVAGQWNTSAPWSP